MRIAITGGMLEAELEGNPFQVLQQQLAQVAQKQDEDIATLGSHINQGMTMMLQSHQQTASKAMQEIASLQSELDFAIEQLLANDQNNPALAALKEKVGKLSSTIKSSKDRLSAIQAKVNNIPKNRVTKIIRKVESDDNVKALNQTIKSVSTKPMSRLKYVKASENTVRKNIAQAGISPHSSESTMHDKLNAKPRMPI